MGDRPGVQARPIRKLIPALGTLRARPIGVVYEKAVERRGNGRDKLWRLSSPRSPVGVVHGCTCLAIMSMQQLSSFSDRRAGQNGGAPSLSVVVPVYKEENNIRPFLERTEPVLERLGSYEIIFCLDPSPDGTEAVLQAEMTRNPRIGLLVFSRRFGQPAATLAGILNSRGRWCVVIDVDLQDPPEVIEQLLRKAEEGFDVVTARRISREGEPWLKTLAASVFYRLIKKIAVVPIPRNTGDFRIMSRRVIEELRGLNDLTVFCAAWWPWSVFRRPKSAMNARPAVRARAITTATWARLKSDSTASSASRRYPCSS